MISAPRGSQSQETASSFGQVSEAFSPLTVETPWEEDQGFAYLSPEEAFPALGELLLAAPVDTEQDEGPLFAAYEADPAELLGQPFFQTAGSSGECPPGLLLCRGAHPCAKLRCPRLGAAAKPRGAVRRGLPGGGFTLALEDSAVVEQYGTVTYAASHSGTQLELAIQYQGDTARGLALFLAPTPTEEP